MRFHEISMRFRGFLEDLDLEVHTLVGAGSSGGEGGGMDAANLLKPALSRGQLQCIGATTLDEYRQYIEKEP